MKHCPLLFHRVGIPSYTLNIVTPLTVGEGIARVITSLKAAGMSTNATAMFYGGHSLGGPVLQNYLNKTYDDPALKPVGQVLMASFLLRNYLCVAQHFALRCSHLRLPR